MSQLPTTHLERGSLLRPRRGKVDAMLEKDYYYDDNSPRCSHPGAVDVQERHPKARTVGHGCLLQLTNTAACLA